MASTRPPFPRKQQQQYNPVAALETTEHHPLTSRLIRLPPLLLPPYHSLPTHGSLFRSRHWQLAERNTTALNNKQPTKQARDASFPPTYILGSQSLLALPCARSYASDHQVLRLLRLPMYDTYPSGDDAVLIVSPTPCPSASRPHLREAKSGHSRTVKWHEQSMQKCQSTRLALLSSFLPKREKEGKKTQHTRASKQVSSLDSKARLAFNPSPANETQRQQSLVHQHTHSH